ncbi:hypothetical protein D9M71_66650 [compost metagenome]
MVQSVAGTISRTLDTANGGKGCGEDGTGKGVPIVVTYAPQVPAFVQNNRSEVRLESGHGQLACMLLYGGKPGYELPMIASVSPRGREHGLAAELGDGICAGSVGGDKGHVLAPAYEAHFRYTPLHSARTGCGGLVAVARAPAAAGGVRTSARDAGRLHAGAVPRQARRRCAALQGHRQLDGGALHRLDWQAPAANLALTRTACGSVFPATAPCLALILTPCVADTRQYHALAAPVFKAAMRFAALTDPVRFASPTADARLQDADAFVFYPSGVPRLMGCGLPALPPGESPCPLLLPWCR